MQLIFEIVNTAFPPVLLDDYYPVSSISWPVATIIIVFPIYILLSWLLNKEYARMPEKRALGIRRWLIYATLFVAGIVIAGDLVFIIYTFINGEIITLGFILKVLAVLIVAGAIFGYYISDLRDRVKKRHNKIFALFAGIIILALIITGFTIIGTPRKQRLLRYDTQKIYGLQDIQSQVVYYWQRKQTLPNSLMDIADPLSNYVAPIDEQSGKAYEYRKLADTKFEICAEFNLPAQRGYLGYESYSKPAMFGTLGNEMWKHDVGRTCFERAIDPELYPPRQKS